MYEKQWDFDRVVDRCEFFAGATVSGDPSRAAGETHEAVSWGSSSKGGTTGESVPSAETAAAQG